MKKTITLALCCALVIAPVQQARPHALMAICLIGGAAIVGGVVVFMIKTCKPKYYCVKDEDGNRFPSNATRAERIANDWKVCSGPYSSAAEAAQYCPPKTNTASLTLTADAAEPFEDEIIVPSWPIKIWKSTNMVDWVLADTILDDPAHFSWYDTNGISVASQAFYRASY